MENNEIIRSCRICGCTDNNCSQCIEKTGYSCYWVDDDLCSACACMGKIKFSDKLILHQIDSVFTPDRDRNKINRILLHFEFYEEDYNALIDRKHIEVDNQFISASEGGELLESFINLLENEYWEKIKEIFYDFEKSQNY